MRALVVSDDDAMSARSGVILRRNGFDFGPTNTIAWDRAVEIVGRHRYDVVVLAMPEACEEGIAALRDMRHLTHATIIAIGPATDPKLILRVLREGANEYLDRLVPDEEFDAFLVRLKTKSLSSNSDGRIFGVISASGGAGASTIACNLASVLARRAKECALFDLDVRAGVQSLLLDAKPVHTVADICRHVERLDPGMLRKSLVAHPDGIRLLASCDDIDGEQRVTPRGIRQALTIARTMFPSVVLDLDRSFAAASAAAIIQSDVVLLVIRLDMTSLHSARQVMDHLNKMGVEDGRIHVVANRYGQKRQLSVKHAEQALAMPIRHLIPDDAASANHSHNSGIPIVMHRPRSRIGKAFQRLGAEMVQMHQDRERAAEAVAQGMRAAPRAKSAPEDPVVGDVAGKARRLFSDSQEGSGEWKSMGPAVGDN